MQLKTKNYAIPGTPHWDAHNDEEGGEEINVNAYIKDHKEELLKNILEGIRRSGELQDISVIIDIKNDPKLVVIKFSQIINMLKQEEVINYANKYYHLNLPMQSTNQKMYRLVAQIGELLGPEKLKLGDIREDLWDDIYE